MARDCKHLQCRDGRYYARVPVPTDLARLYKGNSVRKSLHTSDLRTANERLRAAVGAIQAEFDAKRGHVNPMAREGDGTALGALSLAIALETDPDTKAALRKRQRAMFAELRRNPPAVALPNVETVTAHQLRQWITAANDMLDVMEAMGRDTVADGMSLGELAALASGGALSEVAQAQVNHAIPEVLLPERLRPYVALTKPPTVPSDDNLTLEQLCQKFLTDPKRATLVGATVGRYERTFDLLMEVLGRHTAVRSIKRFDIKRVQDIVIHLPPRVDKIEEFQGKSRDEVLRLVKAKIADGDPVKLVASDTRNGYLKCITTLFAWAADEHLIDVSPAERLTITMPGDKEEADKEPFGPEDLQAMFPRGYVADGLNYLPLLMLYHALRPTEAAQLDVADVVMVDGVWCLDITAETKGAKNGKRFADKAVKNDGASTRKVPIHQRLIDLGFLAYVQSRKNAGETKVFPVKRYGEYGYYPSIRPRFNNWLSGVGVKTETKTPHSFRHTWRTEAFLAISNQDIARVLGGWAIPGGEDVKTYLHKHNLSFRDLKRELDKVDFPVFLAEALPERAHVGMQGEGVARRT